MMRRNHRRGANALEFALLLPVLLAMLFGVFEMSYYFNRYMVVSAAARDGARRAAMVPEGSDQQAEAEAVVFAYLEKLDQKGDASVTTSVLGEAPNRVITVRVDRTYHPLAGGYIPTPGKVTAAFSLRMEDQIP